MLIRHLEFFVTLAEEQHFGRAADLCGVSQPALSLAIRKLEEDLGATLIHRRQRFGGLTIEGERVLAWGRRILADYGGLRDDLTGRRKGGLTGRLRLAAIPSAMPMIAALSARFEARNPMARIVISVHAPDALQRGLDEMAFDGGLTWVQEGPNAIPLRAERLHFACRADHPFAPEPSVPWDEAATQALCLPDDLAAHSCLPPRAAPVAVTCGTLDGVLAHLRTGLWCAAVTGSFADLLGPSDDIVLRPLTGIGAPPVLGLRLPDTAAHAPMVRALTECAAALAADTGAERPPCPPPGDMRT